jgi:hypothetical protein
MYKIEWLIAFVGMIFTFIITLYTININHDTSKHHYISKLLFSSNLYQNINQFLFQLHRYNILRIMNDLLISIIIE